MTQIRASDADDGSFGAVVYRIYGARNFFEIDETAVNRSAIFNQF